MTTDEGQLRAAVIMRDAAEKAASAADRIETAVHRLGVMIEDGYGGNVPRLIELLERMESKEAK